MSRLPHFVETWLRNQSLLRPLGRRVPLFLLAALIAAHLAWHWVGAPPAYVNVDSPGYLVPARSLAAEGRLVERLDIPTEYASFMLVETEDGDLYSRYPPGLSLLLAPTYLLFGPEATLRVDAVLAALSLLLLYLIGRRWTGPYWALAPPLLLAVVPAVNEQASLHGVETAVTSALLLAVWLLDHWAARPGPARALLAGLAWGILPALRYPAVVAGLGAAAFVVVRMRRDRVPARDLSWMAAGAGVPLLLLGLYHQHAFGAFWRTGYALLGEQTAFGFDHFAATFAACLTTLWEETAIWSVLGLVGMTRMLGDREARPAGILCLGIVIPLTLIHAAYYYDTIGGGGFQTRYVVPTLPLYLAAAAWLFWRFRHVRGSAALLAVLVVLSLPIGFARSWEGMQFIRRSRAQMATIVAAVRQHIPPGSVVIAEDPVHRALAFHGEWKLAEAIAMPGAPAVWPGGFWVPLSFSDDSGAEGELRGPSGVAVAPDGTVYVTEMGGDHVRRFGPSGEPLESWTLPEPTARGGFPLGIAVGPDGTVYVSQPDRDRVHAFDPSGRLLLTWGAEGAETGRFETPSGLAVDRGGRVYVADRGNDRLQVFDAKGGFLSAWDAGGAGQADGLANPIGVAVDSSGGFWVTDRDNHRVVMYDSVGRFTGTWGAYGIGAGLLSRPTGVAVGGGKVYVADWDNHRIQVYDSTGAFLTQWGEFGDGDGQFYHPAAVAVSPDQDVYVADAGNGRLQGFTAVGRFVAGWGGRRKTPAWAWQPQRRGRLLRDYRDLDAPTLARRIIEEAKAWGGSGTDVYWVTSPEGVSAFQAVVEGVAEFEEVATVPLPDRSAMYAVPGAPLAIYKLVR